MAGVKNEVFLFSEAGSHEITVEFSQHALHMTYLFTFMCFLRLEGWVYDLSHPLTLQLYGLSDVCT